MNSTIASLLLDIRTKQAITKYDRVVKGLGVRINCDGSSVYIAKYSFLGKQVLKTLCNTELISLEQARKLVLRMKLIAKSGENPLPILETLFAEGTSDRGTITFGRFAKSYLERHSYVHKKSWKKDEQLLKLYLLPPWSEKRIGAITRMDASELHRIIGKRAPYAANRALELFGHMVKMAKVWGHIQESAPNPIMGIRMFKERPRDRFITKDELPKLLEVINAYPNPYVRAALWLDLYTGLRWGELVKLRWDQVSLESCELYLPDSKAGRPHRIPLPSEAVTLLRGLTRVQDNPFLFPGQRKGRYLSRLDKAWYQIRQQAGIPDVRMHDLRRTVGSRLAQTGCSLHLIGRVLNQTTAQVTETYARFQNDDVRLALERNAISLGSALELRASSGSS